MSLTPQIWLHRGALTRAIGAGADPSSSPELARRAEQLTSPACRRKLAEGLRRSLRAAEEPPRPLSTAVPVQRREVLAARRDIERLAEELLTSDEVQPRGIVLVQRLLTQGDSPLFRPSAEGELDDAVRHARAALLLR